MVYIVRPTPVRYARDKISSGVRPILSGEAAAHFSLTQAMAIQGALIAGLWGEPRLGWYRRFTDTPRSRHPTLSGPKHTVLRPDPRAQTLGDTAAQAWG